MTKAEEYFFDNNITVLKFLYTGIRTLFVTDEGKFVETFSGDLYQEVDGKWQLIKKADAATSAIN